MNIDRTVAAFNHFVAVDRPGNEKAFDAVVKTQRDRFKDTAVGRSISIRYDLNNDDLVLFRALCVTIVDVDRLLNA